MEDYNIEQLVNEKEGQFLERKSIRTDIKTIANAIIGFANSDGGKLIIGIYDGKIEGINENQSKINDLLQVAMDYTRPTVKFETIFLDCKNDKNEKDKILIFKIEPSSKVHTNQKDEVYYRIGDETRKLSFDDRLQLMYDKGDITYENTIIKEDSIEDIDLEAVEKYRKIINYRKSAIDLLSEDFKIIKKAKSNYDITACAILVFGKCPFDFFPRSRVRFLRYEGIQEGLGYKMNIIKDIVIEGNLPTLINKTFEIIGNQLREYTKLGNDSKFETIPEYPEFVWQEAIVNRNMSSRL